MKEYPEKHDFVEANQPGFQTERFYLINFLAFFKDTVSQLWLAWMIQGMLCSACWNRRRWFYALVRIAQQEQKHVMDKNPSLNRLLSVIIRKWYVSWSIWETPLLFITASDYMGCQYQFQNNQLLYKIQAEVKKLQQCPKRLTHLRL